MCNEKKEKGQNAKPKIVYQPEYKETQMEIFRKFVEKKYNLQLDDYWKLHEWSYSNFPEFWECVWQFFGIRCSQPYKEVFDRSRSFDNMEWFKGARLNYAENIFKYKDDHVALIATDPFDNEEFITYRQMYEEVCQYARSLRNIGVKKGDCVACYMANKKHAVFAFLATASIGALWCGSLPLQGVQAALSRFQQISPKVIFTSGNFTFEGKEIKMLEKIKGVVEGLPMLEKIVFVPSKVTGVVEDISDVPKCCTINDFLSKAREAYKNSPWELEYEQVAFDYPLNISFTSGTTGLPKRILHSTGAFFASLKDYGIHQDITRKDVIMNFSPVGWISWNMFVNTLHLGVTLCMYEGFPFEESPTRFWDLVDRLGITSTYIWSSTAEDMEKNGFVPSKKHSLKTLRQIFPMGSIMKPSTYEFFPRIKPGIFTQSAYGTTEVYGLIAGFNRNLPVYKGEIHSFSLGMDCKCLDDDGKEVIGQSGSLVIANPFPAMPIMNLPHDEHMTKLRETLLTRFPGYYYVGDEIWINPVTKGFIVYGRCDETLNPKGARFNCSEIYFAPISDMWDRPGYVGHRGTVAHPRYFSNYPVDDVTIKATCVIVRLLSSTTGLAAKKQPDESHFKFSLRFFKIFLVAVNNFPGILDCVCASHYNKNFDERVVLFVKMKPDRSLTDDVKEEIRRVIEENLTVEHVPEIIIQVPDIPYNMTGKKLNMIVKKLINKMPVSNTEYVVNQESLEFYKNVDLGDF